MSLGMIFNVSAQSARFGLTGGLVGTGLYSPADGGADEFETNSGIMMGARYNLKFGPVGLCPELNYINQKYSQIGYMYNGELIEYADPTEFTFNYLSAALLAKLYLGPVNIHAGAQTSFLLSGSIVDDEMDTNVDITDDEFYVENAAGEEYWFFEDMDVAAIFGVGVDLKMGLYVSARATVSITPVFNMQMVKDAADDLDVSEDDASEMLTGSKVDELNRFITTQFTIGYAF